MTHMKKSRRLLLATHCSAGRRRFLSRPCSTERMVGRWTSCSMNRWDCNIHVSIPLSHRKWKIDQKSLLNSMTSQWRNSMTYTAASSDRNLECVAARLTQVFNVQRPVQEPRVTTLDCQLSAVDTNSHWCGPVGAHSSILVMETLELQL